MLILIRPAWMRAGCFRLVADSVAVMNPLVLGELIRVVALTSSAGTNRRWIMYI